MAKKDKIKLLLADSHQIFLDALKYLISEYPEYEIVDQATSFPDVVQKTGELKPDIVIIEMSMPEKEPITVINELERRHNGVKVLALSAYSHKHIIERTLKSGASGFMLKESSEREFIEALKTLRRCEVYMGPKVKNILVVDYVNRIKGNTEGEVPSLSSREYEVIRMLANGRSSKEIGLELDLSPKTVDACRRDIMRKLNLNSLAGIIKYAIREGITTI